MVQEIYMPALSSTMTEGKIVSWSKSTGDKVEKGETLVVVESDKADMDVEAFHNGYLAAVIVDEGQEAPVGEPIALLAESESEIETAQAQAQSYQPRSSQAVGAADPITALTASNSSTTTDASAPSSEAEQPSASEPSSASAADGGSDGAEAATAAAPRSGRTIASPRARKRARELGVDLAAVSGSGPYGRIVAADVEAAAGQRAPTAAPATGSQQGTAAPAPPAAAPAGETVPFNTLERSVADNMAASVHAPTFRVGYTVATDPLESLHQQVKAKGVTMTALLAKAVALTLRQHPRLNASYAQDGIHYPGSINVAVAVAMEDGGLITPVLQNADGVDLYTLSRTWRDLVERARAKQLQPEEYSSGTFTISNLGMYGVDRFDAILPPGQGGILAIGASQPQVVATGEGMMGIRRQMQLNLTCDHRIIYGTHAAAFLRDLAATLESDPQSLAL